MAQNRRAFIFDMDGTIVDNMAFHSKSWMTFFKRRGKDIDAEEFFRRTAGRQGKEIMRAYLGEDLPDAENLELNLEKESVYRELYEPHRKTVSGFDDLIAQAKLRGVALAVATAAPNANIEFTLDGLDLRRHFDAVVGAADVARGKPNPDVFLLAAERCGAAPENCIVFEDAPLGVEAARRAGMRAVVLTTTLPAAAFAEFDNVIHIASDFSELTIDELFAA
ncbi:MAG: HAD family phosphatase [Telluria sp.]|nr:HAD family phosphatase [Telluria sp.]